MNELCMIIKDMVKPNFLNIKTSIQTYDRDALCCGVPCWRWVYHALHSADKWFITPPFLITKLHRVTKHNLFIALYVADYVFIFYCKNFR